MVAVDVVLPVLNEVEALPWVLQRLPVGYAAIVVDNGSTDGSAERARQFGAAVVHEPQRGFGAACFAGLSAATAEIVCFLDADGSLDPTDLTKLVGMVAADEADLALGSRLADRGAWPVHARLANRVLASLVRRRQRPERPDRAGGSAPQLADLGPMRAARRRDLLALDLRDRRFGWPLEMVVKAVAAGWRVAEVPVPYRRREGRSKVTGTFMGTVRTVRDMAAVLRSPA